MEWRSLDQSAEALINEYRTKSPYEVLRIPSSASSGEVRKAYLDMIKAYHPDRADKFLRALNEEISKIVNLSYDSILKERNESR